MLRIRRSLLELPKLSRAFAEGRIAVTKVREIARVATRESEGAWLGVSDRP